MTASKNGKRALKHYRPQKLNANKHTPYGMSKLAQSIGGDGIIGAITVARDGESFDGSARLETLAESMPGVKIVEVETDGNTLIVNRRTDIANANTARAKRLGVAANVIAKLDYNPDGEILAALAAEDEMIAELVKAERDSLRAVQEYAAENAVDAEPQIDRAAELLKKWKVKTGDLFAVGSHRLLCGDSTVRADVERVMDIPLKMMVTDPPYGVEYDANWRNEAAAQGKLAYAASRVSPVENDGRIDWREAWELFSGDVVYCWHADRHASSVQDGLEACEFKIRCQIIWAKSNFPISRGHYHWRHEPCWYAVREGAIAEWCGDRTQTTLWEINLDKNCEGGHSTQKPLECMARPIRNHNGDVYDPFLGSGTTLVACQNLNRRGRGIEISPAYVAVTLERMATAFPDIEIKRL